MNIKAVYKALVTKVKSGLESSAFKSVDFTTTDIKEGFDRPSFFIDIDETRATLATRFRLQKTVPINLYYFPSSAEKNKIELMEMQELLETIFFEPLQIEDSCIFIDELNFSKPEGVLKLNFEFETIEQIDRVDDSEIIESIDYE